MTGKKLEVLTGIEPYRNTYQIGLSYDSDTEEYSEAQTNLYNELKRDINVDKMERFEVLRLFSNGQAEESFDYLKEVLDE